MSTSSGFLPNTDGALLAWSLAVIDPATIDVTLVAVGSWGVDEVMMTVTANSGIVAVDDGGTWAGVVDVGLPFG